MLIAIFVSLLGSQNYRVEALDSQKSAKDQVIKAFKRVSGGATELRQTRQYSAQELIRLRKKVKNIFEIIFYSLVVFKLVENWTAK